MNPEGAETGAGRGRRAGRGRGADVRVEAEATEGRGGVAEDTVGRGTKEATARRAEKRQKSQRRITRGNREEGRTEGRKTLMERNPPTESTRAPATKKTRQAPN